MRKYELPYNFDKNLIYGYKSLKIPNEAIDCIYLPPFIDDYKTIHRSAPSNNDTHELLSYDEYVEHLYFINENYPGKLQLLLQRTDGTLMSPMLIKKYIGLGIRNFCVGSIEQAKIIKQIDPTIKVVGSIAMHISKEKLLKNPEEYKKYFDIFVLDFGYNKNFSAIKNLPKDFKYMLLVNSRCNIMCGGDHHWWHLGAPKCPGIAPSVSFHNSCMIRPMDLSLFDPYIKVYKIQDRGWPTDMILKDVTIYTTQDYEIYMGSMYIPDPNLYQSF